MGIEDWYRLYVPRLVRRLVGMFGFAEDDALSIVHDVLVRAWTKPRDIRVSPYVWLLRCCINQAYNVVRDGNTHARLHREHASDLVPSGPLCDLAVASGKDDLVDVVRFLVRHLTARDMELALLVWVLGMSQEEAAAVVGISDRQVRNVLGDVMKKIGRLAPEWGVGRKHRKERGDA